jgi:chromosome segregation ATPase
VIALTAEISLLEGSLRSIKNTQAQTLLELQQTSSRLASSLSAHDETKGVVTDLQNDLAGERAFLEKTQTELAAVQVDLGKEQAIVEKTKALLKASMTREEVLLRKVDTLTALQKKTWIDLTRATAKVDSLTLELDQLRLKLKDSHALADRYLRESTLKNKTIATMNGEKLALEGKLNTCMAAAIPKTYPGPDSGLVPGLVPGP